MDFSKLIEIWEQDIRQGQVNPSNHSLFKLNFRKIPDQYRTQIAGFFRRLGYADKGLKVLTPCVLDIDSNLKPILQVETKVEYSALLLRFGLFREAQSILSSVSSSSSPDVMFFKALACIGRWDYELAIPLLNSFCQHSDVSQYRRQVGMINQIACLTHIQDFEKAESLHQELEQQMGDQKNVRLRANLLELKTQRLVQQDQLAQAEKYISQSETILSNDPSLDKFFIDKWRAYLTAKKMNSIAPLLKFSEIVFQREHWETLRDLDYLMLKIEFDSTLFKKLIYGTPNAEFRKRIYKKFSRHPEENFGFIGTNSNIRIDIARGTINDRQLFPLAKLTHQMFWAVFYDHYRSQSVGHLFDLIYPDEAFNIFSSPAKIYQLVSRTRLVLAKHNLSHLIFRTRHGYRPFLCPEIQFKVEIQRQKPEELRTGLHEIKRVFGSEKFTVSEVESLFNFSNSSARRYLRQALKEGELIQTKKRARVAYQVVDHELNQKVS